ncbi:glucan biosynthesis protein [Methylobacterium oryzae CBMB20]
MTFFHLGNFFRHPVKVYALEGGQAREVLYGHDLFTYPPGNPARGRPGRGGLRGVPVPEGARRPAGRRR